MEGMFALYKGYDILSIAVVQTNRAHIILLKDACHIAEGQHLVAFLVV